MGVVENRRTAADGRLRGRSVLDGQPFDVVKDAFVRLLTAEFTPSKWRELGDRFGCGRVIQEQPILLRSDAERNRDYAGAVAEVVPRLLGQKTYGGRVVELTNVAHVESFVGLESWLRTHDPLLAAELYGHAESAPAVAVHRDGDEPSAAEPRTDRRTVFLVHGRDHRMREALSELLRSLDLRVLSWDDASALTEVATPYTGDVIVAGMEASDGVVVLMTPDDLARLRPDLALPVDGEAELALHGQPRMNVVFEAGMALARDRDGVVIVQVGKLRVMSDIAGLNVIQLCDDVESRRQLGSRLRQIGLDVDMDHDRWRDASAFGPAGDHPDAAD